MWALAPILFLAAAIFGHALLCRMPLAINSVSRFLLSGSIVGITLCTFALARWGVSIESAAAIAVYAAACELYVFLFMLVSGSVSLLYRLRFRTLSSDEIEAVLGGRSMVDRRIANMISVGLLQRGTQGFAQTQRGAFSLWIYRGLRNFSGGHP